ncbi:MAG: amidohydrolase [Halieaceae bacterium]
MNWKAALVILVALIVGLTVVFRIATRIPEPPAHQVFINGDVITLDENSRVVEALSARGDRIEAVGSTGEIMALVTDDTEVIDLRGRTLLPGFIDAHGHFPGSGMEALGADVTSPPVGDVETVQQAIEKLREAAVQHPDGWIMGMGYDDTLLAEKRHLNRDDLDKVSLDRPVGVSHVSGHMIAVNSKALELLGITAETPDPPGGVIQRRQGSQEPNGVLDETARDSAMAALMDLSLPQVFSLTKRAVSDYARHGVTTAQSGGMDGGLLKALALFSNWGVVPQRLVLFPFFNLEGEAILSGEFDLASFEGDRVIMPAVKIVADGSIQGYTGYLSQPYHVPYRGDGSYRGYPTLDRETLFEQVLALHMAGYQLAIHGNGDAAIEDILDAFETAQAQRPVADPRMILIHSQMAREDQIARMKALGVTPSFFSAHTYYWGDRHREIFMGPERAANMSPARWAQQHGVRFSSHMDTPVTPMRPLQAVWSMVHRLSYGGVVVGEAQRINVMDALRAVTIDAAWQVFQESNRGTLEPGKYADLVVLSGNPLDNPMNMRDLSVERTLVGGVTIYRRR